MRRGGFFVWVAAVAVSVGCAGVAVTVGVGWGSVEAQELGIRIQWKKTDFSKKLVDLDEFLDGGVGKDGIPSIDVPVFVSASEVGQVEGLEDMGELEPVVWFKVGGDERAYPLRILTWHEIVNDVVGGIPVAVTYCPLCNSALVFDRRWQGQGQRQGQVLEFGVSGLLRHSDLVMWDRQKEGWWQQFTGMCLVGWCAGESLKILPARLVSWQTFKSEAGKRAKVLMPPSEWVSRRSYGDNPYVRYDHARNKPFLYRGALPEGIPAMARVVSLGTRGAVAFSLLRRKGEVRLQGGEVIRWRKGQASALDVPRISEGRDVGEVEVRDKRGRVVRHEVPFAFVHKAFYPNSPLVVEEKDLQHLR